MVQFDFKDDNSDKNSLVVIDGEKMSEVLRVDTPQGEGPVSSMLLVEHVAGNVYEAASLEVRRSLGVRNRFLTVTPKGIQDNITRKEAGAVFDVLKKTSSWEEALLRDQVLHDCTAQVISTAPQGIFSAYQIFECLEKVGNDEILLSKGLKFYAETRRVESRYNDHVTLEEREWLFDIINDNEKKKVVADENNLKNLVGLSFGEIDGFNVHKQSVRLALEAYDVSKLSDLVRITANYEGEPATELLTKKYREVYGDEVVDGIVQHANEIIKLPYKRMFWEALPNEYNNSPEANFLDEYTFRLKALAKGKYNEKSDYHCISNQKENPAFMQDADTIWKEMFAEADKYTTLEYNMHDARFVGRMFPEQIGQLKEFVDKKYTFDERLAANIAYFGKVGKMQQAIDEYCKDTNSHLNGNLPFDLVNAGVESKKEAKRCLDIWEVSSKRP